MRQGVYRAAERGVRLRLPVEPHELRVEQDLCKAEWHTRPVAGVLGAGFEDEDPVIGILGESCRDDCAGGAAADDHEVVVLWVGRHGGYLPFVPRGRDSLLGPGIIDTCRKGRRWRRLIGIARPSCLIGRTKGRGLVHVPRQPRISPQ